MEGKRESYTDGCYPLPAECLSVALAFAHGGDWVSEQALLSPVRGETPTVPKQALYHTERPSHLMAHTHLLGKLLHGVKSCTLGITLGDRSHVLHLRRQIQGLKQISSTGPSAKAAKEEAAAVAAAHARRENVRETAVRADCQDSETLGRTELAS